MRSSPIENHAWIDAQPLILNLFHVIPWLQPASSLQTCIPCYPRICNTQLVSLPRLDSTSDIVPLHRISTPYCFFSFITLPPWTALNLRMALNIVVADDVDVRRPRSRDRAHGEPEPPDYGDDEPAELPQAPSNLTPPAPGTEIATVPSTDPTPPTPPTTTGVGTLLPPAAPGPIQVSVPRPTLALRPRVFVHRTLLHGHPFPVLLTHPPHLFISTQVTSHHLHPHLPAPRRPHARTQSDSARSRPCRTNHPVLPMDAWRQ